MSKTLVVVGCGLMGCDIAAILCHDLSAFEQRPQAGPLTEPVVEVGNFGAKGGSGFWDWTPEQMKEQQEKYEQTLL